MSGISNINVNQHSDHQAPQDFIQEIGSIIKKGYLLVQDVHKSVKNIILSRTNNDPKKVFDVFIVASVLISSFSSVITPIILPLCMIRTYIIVSHVLDTKNGSDIRKNLSDELQKIQPNIIQGIYLASIIQSTIGIVTFSPALLACGAILYISADLLHEQMNQGSQEQIKQEVQK